MDLCLTQSLKEQFLGLPVNVCVRVYACGQVCVCLDLFNCIGRVQQLHGDPNAGLHKFKWPFEGKDLDLEFFSVRLRLGWGLR